MNVREVMEQLFEVPIEQHETTQVRIALYDPDTDEPWTLEQHEALNAKFEITFSYQETPEEMEEEVINVGGL